EQHQSRVGPRTTFHNLRCTKPLRGRERVGRPVASHFAVHHSRLGEDRYGSSRDSEVPTTGRRVPPLRWTLRAATVRGMAHFGPLRKPRVHRNVDTRLICPGPRPTMMSATPTPSL